MVASAAATARLPAEGLVVVVGRLAAVLAFCRFWSSTQQAHNSSRVRSVSALAVHCPDPLMPAGRHTCSQLLPLPLLLLLPLLLPVLC
jgi:hypothetical protein